VSYSVDRNVLLDASDRASPRHATASRFLAERAADPDVFYVAWPTSMAYVRIATHPRIFAEPLSPAEAVGDVDRLLRLPRVRALSEAEGFLQVYQGGA